MHGGFLQPGRFGCLLSLFLGLAGADASISAAQVTERSFNLHRWTTEHGLPQNTVISLAQTADGYIWAGTRAGLARFDGIRFTNFTREFLVDNHEPSACLDLTVDGKNRLWARFVNTLVCYEPGRLQKFSIQALALQTEIQTASASRNGGIWLGLKQRNLCHFEPGSPKRESLLVKPTIAEIGLISEDNQNRLWIGSGGHTRPLAWWRFDPANGELFGLEQILGSTPPNPQEVITDKLDRLWLVVPNELLCWSDGQLLRYDASAFWNAPPIHRLRLDRDGSLWLPLKERGRVVRFHNGHFELFNLEPAYADLEIRDILPDREGNLWIGTGAHGLIQIQPHRMPSWSWSQQADRSREVHSVVTAGTAVWLATGSEVLRLCDGQLDRFAQRADGDPLTHVMAVLEDRSGEVWVKATDGLFQVANGQLARVNEADLGRTNWKVTALHQDRLGRLWIGSDQGLLERCEGRFSLYTRSNGLSDDVILGIQDAPDGSLWVGTESGGLNHWQHGRFQVCGAQGLASGRARPLLVEDDGTLWAATPVGLCRIRPGQIRLVTESHGLLHNEPYNLLPDGLGNYWGHCNRGIFRLSRAELHRVADGLQPSLHCVTYGEADGMASTEGNGDFQPNAARTPDGRFWFPMTRGVVVFDPGEVLRADQPPPMVIENVEADDEMIYADGDRIAKVKLPAGRARWLKIQYTANSFVNSHRMRFQYMLEGYDREWRKVTDERLAYYADLKPGDYTFRLKAANPHGVWNEIPAPFGFSVAPHYYETTPFYLLCAAAIVLAAVAFHHHRVRVLQRIDRLQREQALQTERARIARDLHDDLGANLTGIALKADLAQRQFPEPGAAAEQFAEIAGSTRALVDHMRVTVWALNPKHDTVEGLARFLAQYVEDFVADAGLRCRLQLPDQFAPAIIPSPARYEIHMIVKEALHNAIKHSGAQEIQFHLRVEGSELCLDIADDGHGFKLENGPIAAHTGNGLANIAQRVQALGAKLDLQSAPQQGTRVSIRIPLPKPQSPLTRA